jgi:hypothetical protein
MAGAMEQKRTAGVLTLSFRAFRQRDVLVERLTAPRRPVASRASAGRPQSTGR